MAQYYVQVEKTYRFNMTINAASEVQAEDKARDLVGDAYADDSWTDIVSCEPVEEDYEDEVEIFDEPEDNPPAYVEDDGDEENND